MSEKKILPALRDSVVIISGLPRSGTSMLMQMVAAGGVPVLTDGLREADEDNPRGYLEYEPVKKLQQDSSWVGEAKGKAVKIVAPLLGALPAGVPCLVMLMERDLDEILDSQAQMLIRRKVDLPDTAERRERLTEAFTRSLEQARVFLGQRQATGLLVLQRAEVLRDPGGAARQIDAFLGGGLDVGKMAAEVDPRLHRQRRG